MQKKKVMGELSLIETEEKIIEQRQEQILKEIESKKKELLNLKKLVKKFDFADFAQTVVGAGVFGLPMLFTPDFWGYIEVVSTGKLVFMHFFFLLCVVITLNYAYRDNFSPDSKFLVSLARRVFYMYVTVFLTVFILMWSLEQFGPNFPTIDMIRNFLAMQSIGLIGAVTFQFMVRRA